MHMVEDVLQFVREREALSDFGVRGIDLDQPPTVHAGRPTRVLGRKRPHVLHAEVRNDPRRYLNRMRRRCSGKEHVEQAVRLQLGDSLGFFEPKTTPRHEASKVAEDVTVHLVSWRWASRVGR